MITGDRIDKETIGLLTKASLTDITFLGPYEFREELCIRLIAEIQDVSFYESRHIYVSSTECDQLDLLDDGKARHIKSTSLYFSLLLLDSKLIYLC